MKQGKSGASAKSVTALGLSTKSKTEAGYGTQGAQAEAASLFLGMILPTSEQLLTAKSL